MTEKKPSKLFWILMAALPALLFILVLFLLIWQLYRERQYMGVVVLASLFIYTLVEAHIISVYLARDYTLFLIGARFGALLHADKGKRRYFFQIPAALFRKTEERA